MTPDQIERAANALVAARKGSAIAGLPGDAIPQSEADSYQCRTRCCAKLGEASAAGRSGFRRWADISPPRSTLRRYMRARRPCRRAGSRSVRHRVRDRLPLQQGRLARSATPAVENPIRDMRCLRRLRCTRRSKLSTSRYQDFRSLDRLLVLADNFSNGALVYGPAASNWDGIDLAHPPIEVTANGKHFADCTGLRAGTPIELVLAAVQYAIVRRGGIASHWHGDHHRHPHRPCLHRAGRQDRRRFRPARPGRGIVLEIKSRFRRKADRVEIT